MPGVEQYQRHLHELAEQRRQNATQQRTGTVHKVWCKDGEQKVQVQIGICDDGTPWLTPWLHYGDDHSASQREEKKIQVGHSVSVTNISSDFRQASVDHHSTNQKHQRPQHATEQYHTHQYGQVRETIWGGDDGSSSSSSGGSSGGGGGTTAGAASGGGGGSGTGGFWEQWLSPPVQQAQSAQQQQQAGGFGSASDSDSAKIQPDPPDDVSKAVVCHRIGTPPESQKDTGQPYDGPGTGGKQNVLQSTLHWIKGKSQKGPPRQTTSEHHTQHGEKTHGVMADENIQHKVQKQADDDSGAARTIHEQGKITHHVGQKSKTQMDASSINQQTGDHYIAGTNSSWLHSDGKSHIHGSPILTNMMVMHSSHNPPSFTASGRLDDTEPLGDDFSYLGDEYYIQNGACITASYSSPSPPDGTDPLPFPPFNGMRWIDTTSGIEYSFYVIQLLPVYQGASLNPNGPVFSIPSLGDSIWIGISLFGSSPGIDAPSLGMQYGVWSENGGKIPFPPSPSLGDIFTYPPASSVSGQLGPGQIERSWYWNGVGWESTILRRLVYLELLTGYQATSLSTSSPGFGVPGLGGIGLATPITGASPFLGTPTLVTSIVAPSLGSLGVSPYMQGVLADANAAAARTDLGLGTAATQPSTAFVPASNYSTGSYTPVAAGGFSGIGYGSSGGAYVKIGQLCTFSAFLTINSVSKNASGITVSLPFTYGGGSCPIPLSIQNAGGLIQAYGWTQFNSNMLTIYDAATGAPLAGTDARITTLPMYIYYGGAIQTT